MTGTPRPDSGSSLSRREFVRGVGTAALAASASRIGAGRVLAVEPTGPTPRDPAGTAVARFYRSLKDDQKKILCFPFDHPLRKRVNNNWAIVKPRIIDLTTGQQALCREIFRNLCSEEGYERFERQMAEDDGGFHRYHVAVFGEPFTDQPFEWVLTGRHVTLRADGNSLEDAAAFGGPIFCGHASHTDNVWRSQGQQASTIFQTLDDHQKCRALVATVPAEKPRSIRLHGDSRPTTGLDVADLDSQQKAMVQQLLRDMLMPFRKVDAEAMLECLRDAHGADKLRLTFYKNGDIDDDGPWALWRLEGPAFAWSFHGSPHVHTWLNVARRSSADPTQG